MSLVLFRAIIILSYTTHLCLNFDTVSYLTNEFIHKLYPFLLATVLANMLPCLPQCKYLFQESIIPKEIDTDTTTNSQYHMQSLPAPLVRDIALELERAELELTDTITMHQRTSGL